MHRVSYKTFSKDLPQNAIQIILWVKKYNSWDNWNLLPNKLLIKAFEAYHQAREYEKWVCFNVERTRGYLLYTSRLVLPYWLYPRRPALVGELESHQKCYRLHDIRKFGGRDNARVAHDTGWNIPAVSLAPAECHDCSQSNIYVPHPTPPQEIQTSV